MPLALPIAVLPLLVLVGSTGTLALRELWRARSGEDAEQRAWSATVAATATTTTIARIVQRSTIDPERAALGVSLQYTLAALLVVLFVLFAPTARPRRRLTVAVLLGLVALHLTTPAFLGRRYFVRTDCFGESYYAFSVGPLVLLLVPLSIWALMHWIRSIRAMKGRAPWSMSVVVTITLACAASFVHDVLLNQAVIHSVHMLEYAFAAVAFLTSAQISQHVRTRYEGLATNMQHSMNELAESRRLLDQTLDELARTKKGFPRLAESALDGILVHDGDRVVDANDALCEIFGAPLDELRGRRVAELFEGGERPEAEAALFARVDAPRELVAKAKPKPEAKDKDHARVPVDIMGRSAQNGDAVLYVVSVRDITFRKEAEARQVFTDRMVSIATLAAGAAHEINNPLTYVTTNIALAIEDATGMTADVLEGLREAEEGCDRIRRIVQDLGSLSRDQGEALGQIDLDSVVDRALRMAEHQLRQRATVVRESQATARVLANEARLGQVFLNLIVNAAQAIPEGQASAQEVRVTTRDEGDRVIVEVTDTGSGIAAEDLPRIFDPFFTTKAHSGTGLGLSVCHGIVAQFGGDITVESHLGVGTTFRVSLPACPASAPLPAPTSRKLPVATARRARILVVDDEPSLVMAIARALRAHEVTTAQSGAEALDLLGRTDFDLVLCDLMMPTVTGMDVYDRIRGVDPDLAGRIVFMTGGAFTSRAADFVADPATKCIAKPLDFAELSVLVNAALARATGVAPSHEARDQPA
jgi:PAS domain S-box-containing protein